MTRLLPLFLALLALVGGATPAAAHTRSESHSTWTIDGRAVRLAFSVADREAKRITNGERPGDAQLIAYLAPRLGATAGGKVCPLVGKPRAVAAATGFRRVEFLYDCPSAERIVLHDTAFFALVPTHVNMAQIQTAKGDFSENVLTADATTIDLEGTASGGLDGAGFLTFVRMGIMHIFTGIDHMSFLLGLVLISRRFKDLAFVITGFTLGHSLTLALSVTGLLRPHAEFIDALVALTIALIGVENLAVQSGRIGLLALSTAAALFAMAALRMLGICLFPVTLLFGAGELVATHPPNLRPFTESTPRMWVGKPVAGALYRGGRGDGRSGGRDRQGAIAPGRGKGRDDEEARQARNAADARRTDGDASVGAGGMASGAGG